MPKTSYFTLLFFSLISFSSGINAQTYNKPIPTAVKNLDPQAFTDAYSLAVINQIYDRLFDIDELNTIKPKLVSTWETNRDGTIYKICLKDNVTFHDGKMLSSNDVIFTLKRIILKKSVIHNELSIIKGATAFKEEKKNILGIKAISPQCLSIELERPYPLFINMLATPHTEILPNDLRGKSEESFFSQPIGTGPFKVAKYSPSEYVELTANDKYFLGPPKLKTIVYEKTNRLDAINKFNSGHFQDLEWFQPQTTELTTNYFTIKTPVSTTYVLALNLNRPPFNNIHYRKALEYAINKNLLVSSCFPGNTIARGYVPPGLAGYNKELPDYEYDIQKAKEEIKASRLSKDILAKKIVILRSENYPCKEVFKKLIESDLKAVGINAEVTHIPFSEIMSKHYRPKDFDIINISFTADFPEALFMLNYFRGNSEMNYSGLALKEVDDLLNRANASTDRFERYQIYEKIQEILYNNAVTVNLYYHLISIVMQDNVKGFLPSPLGLYYPSMWSVYLEEDEK